MLTLILQSKSEVDSTLNATYLNDLNQTITDKPSVIIGPYSMKGDWPLGPIFLPVLFYFFKAITLSMVLVTNELFWILTQGSGTFT